MCNPTGNQHPSCAAFRMAVVPMSLALHPDARAPPAYLLILFVCNVQGTGIVTSVPSDAPDDYAALMDLGEGPPCCSCRSLPNRHCLPPCRAAHAGADRSQLPT